MIELLPLNIPKRDMEFIAERQRISELWIQEMNRGLRIPLDALQHPERRTADSHFQGKETP